MLQSLVFFVVNNNKQNNALQTEVVDLNTGLTYSGGWYLISSKSYLNTVRDNMANGKGLGYNYKLTADIDASSSEWVPFGYNASSGEYNIFTGKFNGDGHKIKIKLPQKIEIGKENVGDYRTDLGIIS